LNKKLAKRLAGKCQLCGNDCYEVLDIHRLVPGSKKGKYTNQNTICACSNCHRKVHAGKIQIIGKHPCTSGRDVVHFINENGEEVWK